MINQDFETDIVIIGAGPVGLFSIFQMGMLDMKCHVIDALDQIGGQCTALYPEKPIYDIPAYPKIMATDLIEQLEEQAKPFSPVYHLGQQVVSFSKNDNGFTVTTSKSKHINCKAIVIAAGGGAFGPNKPPLKNIEDYEGISIFYSCRNKEQFRDKKIMISGGGDSAVDWAISLSEISDNISIIHRRDKFRAAPESINKLNTLVDNGKINKITPYQLKSLNGNNGQLESVTISDMDDNHKDIETDMLLPFYGLSMDIGPLTKWGIELENNHIKIDHLTSSTNIKGIYAIGDIATYERKLKLILTGFAEAASAAHDAYRMINSTDEIHMEYSTSKGLKVI